MTWRWTINAFGHGDNQIANPSRWWPGASYVTWVGIDGYYYQPSQQFSTLFRPSITAVRKLTEDPILIAETGASPQAGKAAKITDLLYGVSENRLLGFVWFDAKAKEDWQLEDSPTALAAFRTAAEKLQQQ